MTMLVADIGDGNEAFRYGMEHRIDNTSTPQLLIRTSNGDRFYLRENITIKCIKHFYNQYKNNELVPFYMS